MPEGTPFHTLPYEEILERIRGLTNLRVVPDEKSGTGYRVEYRSVPRLGEAAGVVMSLRKDSKLSERSDYRRFVMR